MFGRAVLLAEGWNLPDLYAPRLEGEEGEIGKAVMLMQNEIKKLESLYKKLEGVLHLALDDYELNILKDKMEEINIRLGDYYGKPAKNRLPAIRET